MVLFIVFFERHCHCFCNRTLALDPSCIEALSTRASPDETIRCLPDSLHDLEHLKLLYNSILRDRKLPGPAWKRQNIGYNEIPGKLCSMVAKIQAQKQRVASGEIGNVDYYALMGLKDREKMSALLLFRLIQRGYTNLMRVVLDEEASEKQRKKTFVALHQSNEGSKPKTAKTMASKKLENQNQFQGVFVNHQIFTTPKP